MLKMSSAVLHVKFAKQIAVLARANRAYSCSIRRSAAAEQITINWKKPDGTIIPTKADTGSNLMVTAHRNSIDLEGACEGVCACSTCHVILSDDVFQNLPEPSEDEEDMLGN
jgi:ferredoxin